MICSNVLNQDVKTVPNHYEHLKNLQLADFSNESIKCIDVLIGIDYSSCILGETKRERPFRTIMNTLKIYNWQIFQMKVLNV